MIDDCDALCNAIGLVHVVCSEEDSRTVGLVELPDLRSSNLSSLNTALAPFTATPRAVYFSTPNLYEVKSLLFPIPSAAPMQRTIGRFAGDVMGSLAPEFEAEAKMRMPR